MKATVLAFAVLFASVSAIPQIKDERTLQQERIVDDVIISLIEDLIASIREAGLDPYYLDRAESSWALPVPSILSVWGYGEGVQLTGLSNIVVNSVSYGLLSGRLQLDLSMPELWGAVAAAGGKVTVFGNEINGEGTGTLRITGIRVTADAVVRIGLSGVSLSSLDIVGSIDDIASDITAVVNGYDLSPYINAAFNDVILRYLNEFADEVNELLSYYALIVINNRL